MLALDTISRARLQDHPFRWAHVEDAFASPQAALRLSRELPENGFRWTSRVAGSDKTYRMASLALVEDDVVVEDVLGDLSAGWRAALDQIRSPGYRIALEALTRRSLEGTRLEARLCKYAASCWMAPHTDRPDKLVTHVVYLNPEWDARWGGGLEILASDRREDIVEEVVPRLGSSAVIVRSDSSWHAVAPVRPDVAVERVSLLVHFTGG